MTKMIEIDDTTANLLFDFSQETKLNPSQVIQEAITAYRRQRANEKYLGTGLLDLSDDHPSETKQSIKKALKEKYGYTS